MTEEELAKLSADVIWLERRELDVMAAAIAKAFNSD